MAVLDKKIQVLMLKGQAAKVSIGRVTTVTSSTPASVTNSGTPDEAVFDFTIPKGPKGDPGATVTTYTATIPMSGWSSTVPYTQVVSVSGILSSDTPIIDVNLSADTNTAITQLDAWACVSKITTSNGSLTVTCLEEKPTTNIPIQLKVVR